MPAAIVHLHDRQASCAPARRVPSVPADAYARGDATPRPRLALQVVLTMAAAKTPSYAEGTTQAGVDPEAPGVTEQSESIDSGRGTGSQAAGSSSSSRLPPTRTRGDDAALQAAWVAIGRAEEYVGPGEREQADLADARNRGRGKAAQAERLKREWERLERAREEAEAHEEAEAQDADMDALPGLSSLEVSAPPSLPPPPPLPSLPAPTEGDCMGAPRAFGREAYTQRCGGAYWAVACRPAPMGGAPRR